MKARFLNAWDSFVDLLKKSLFVIIPLLIIFGCGLVTRAWWLTLSETFRQVVLTAVGLYVGYTVVALIVLAIIIGLYIWSNWHTF